jgi:hypothetical protein
MISLIKYASIGIAFYVIFSGMFTVNYSDNGEVAFIFNGIRDGYWTEFADKAVNDVEMLVTSNKN